MTSAPILDTHAWVWWMDRDPRLGKKIIEALDQLDGNDRPFLCDISLWEVATLVERRRLRFTVPFAEWLRDAAHPRTVRTLEITPAIAEQVGSLPAGFHRDPADRLIVATCIVMQLPLVTRDQRITRSRLVSAWSPEI